MKPWEWNYLKGSIVIELHKLGRPIRLPTAQWLFSDLYGTLDANVRLALSELKDEGKLTIDNGGWISLPHTSNQ